MALPSRVEAADSFLRWALWVESPRGDSAVPGRDLTAEEETVKNAAIEVFRLYLTGEMHYGDVLPESSTKPERERIEETPVRIELDKAKD